MENDITSRQDEDYEDILSSIRNMLESDEEFSSAATKSESPMLGKVFDLTPDMLVVLGNKVKVKDKAVFQAGIEGSLDSIFKKWLISHKKEIIGLINSDKSAK